MSKLDPMFQADLDARLRRFLLRAARNGAPVQDLIDCADLARAMNRDAMAAKLDGLVMLRSGWGRAIQTGCSVDLAIAELKALLPLGPTLAAADLRLPPLDPGPHQRPAPPTAAVAAVTKRTDALLNDMPMLIEDDGLTERLRALRDDVLALPPIPPDEHVATDLAVLAALVGLEQLRRFLIANGGLLDVTTGGRPLLEAAAKLGPAALGPYFTNVRMLIRSARDIFALIDAAGDRPSHGEAGTWCVLLSAHLHHHQLADLVNELGDRGMTSALAHVLARAARADGPHYPLDPVWRVRDVCLDIGELGTAADAQHLIARWRPRDPNEWRILAEIRVEMDDAAGVEAALEQALALCPNDPAIRRQLTACKAGTMPPIAGGYGNPPGLQRVRQARLKAYRAIA